MNENRHRRYRRDTLTLDGEKFIACTFDRCTFVYSGGEFVLDGCTFNGCNFEWSGSAWNTIQLLAMINYLRPEIGPQVRRQIGTKSDT
jgi:hypothetical protein